MAAELQIFQFPSKDDILVGFEADNSTSRKFHQYFYTNKIMDAVAEYFADKRMYAPNIDLALPRVVEQALTRASFTNEDSSILLNLALLPVLKEIARLNMPQQAVVPSLPSKRCCIIL
jgi:hypothetical protein